MTNAKRRRLWRDLVADYRASDLPVRKWCENHGVTKSQLHYWLGKIEEASVAPESSEPRSSTWARLEIVEDSSETASLRGDSSRALRLGSGQVSRGSCTPTGMRATTISPTLRRGSG